jgi:hypothetical protein
MRVLIDAAFFAGPEAEDPAFLNLFALASDGRHVILTRPAFVPRGPSAIEQWLSQLPTRTAAQFRQVLSQGPDAAARMPAGAVGITVASLPSSDWSAGQLCLPDALRLLQTPLGVMVENRRADWRFLLALAPLAQRDHLRRALDRGWLEILHAGGLGEMKAWLKDLVEQPFASASNAARLLRLWVMFDRDADPADRSQPSRASLAMKDLCQSAPERPWPLGHHQLDRRTIENYLPETALRRWQSDKSGAEGTKRRKMADALCKLRRDKPQAARQYNMKSGLLADLSPAVRKEVEEKARRIQDADLDPLFHGLSDTDRGALKNGFGKNIAAYLEHASEADFRREFERNRAPGEPDRETILNTLFARL